MTNLFTARQVQEILKVDRITIYRMLNDGRLKGIKVGSHWRFSAEEIERILSGERQLDTVATESGSVFPVHCVQTIQDLLSGVSTVSALVIDVHGNRVTRWSSQTTLSVLVDATPAGKTAYQAALQDFAAHPGDRFLCPAGLHSVAAPIRSNGNLVGWFLVGQVFHSNPDVLNTATLSARFGLVVGQLEAATAEVAVVGREQWNQIEGWAVKAAQAVESILSERTNFIQRLQKIADLTQVG